MVSFVVHLLVTAVLLLVVAKVVSGVQIKGLGSAIVAALVLGLVNALVRPIAVFLTFPLTIATLGLFLLIINALMLWLASALVPGMRVQGFGAAFLGSLVLTLLNLAVSLVLGEF